MEAANKVAIAKQIRRPTLEIGLSIQPIQITMMLVEEAHHLSAQREVDPEADLHPVHIAAIGIDQIVAGILVVLRHPLAEVVHISKAGLHDRGVPTGVAASVEGPGSEGILKKLKRGFWLCILLLLRVGGF